ncbi:hypothetical protein BST61_g6209 [Cercospora zeina]
MSNTSNLLSVPALSEPIHPEQHSASRISDREPKMAEAESLPSQSSRTSLSTDEKTLLGSSHRNSNSSNEDGPNERLRTYADNTNTEPTEPNAYDHDRIPSAMVTPSPSQSQSRSKASYDMHRTSQDGGNRWADDKEAKQKKMLRRFLDHKLAPSFLK